MSTSLYDLTIPIFIRNLESLDAVLSKGEAFASEKGIDPSELLEARLYEDMAPLISQIQRVSDSAKGTAVRLGGVENVVMADEEKTFADLHARIAKTIAFLKTVPRDAIDGKEEAQVTLQTPRQTFDFTGLSFVQTFVLPNFYFHMTTAYGLLRMKGVPLGKLDYLGGI
ncbi:DUF1993 domain-containing protein [Sphingomonas glacialis]|uniref:DUF1993 domain-containing protein n=1 Tax=Sphingomonas glacialis TaxID=658225 RepID=A0A502FZD6_9SPHN|nr:DUF1993 domain-containing protein [Sphingomonas glacialis]TPG55007.1 DUF1993 domain-containing protein [Sphingomonas glacialis]